MILPIVKFPDDMLTKRCETVKRITKDLVQLGKDMIQTLEHHEALGLAACQIGELVRIIAIKQGKKSLLMYNPTIVSQSHTKRSNKESCLSFEKTEQYNVKRPTNVKVKYQDINNKLKFVYLEGLEAIAFFHEHDHLQGVTMDVNGEKVD